MKQNFEYNPFAGILEDDLEEILVPRFDLGEIILKINTSESLAIEFLGKKGRGKTTHLVYLQKKLNQYPIFLLNRNSTLLDIIKHPSKIIFIDSIHHLNILERIKLFREKKVIIYTTHWSKKGECYLGGKKCYSINFNGINSETLLEIVNKRLKLSAIEELEDETLFSINEIDALIKQFGDNYREIINHLFKKYQ